MIYNYYPEYYVGININKSNGERLAYLTQKTDDSSFSKRKENVDIWLGWGKYNKNYENETFIINNSPTKGFKFVDCVRRYSTSNKLLRVEDPRGWEFEISIENLADIMPYINIANGVIQEELFYTKNKSGGIAIVPTDKVSIPSSKIKKIDFNKLEDNSQYRYQNQDYIYLGEIEVGYQKIRYSHLEEDNSILRLQYKEKIEEFARSVPNYHFSCLIDFSRTGSEKISVTKKSGTDRVALYNPREIKKVILLGKSSENFDEYFKTDSVYINKQLGFAFNAKYKDEFISRYFKNLEEMYGDKIKIFKVAPDIYILGKLKK